VVIFPDKFDNNIGEKLGIQIKGGLKGEVKFKVN